MPKIVSLKVPEETFRMLRAQLSPKQFRQAMYGVVNRTLSKLLTTVKRRIREENPLIKAKYLSRAISLVKPAGDPPTGAIVVNNKRIPLAAFKLRGFKNPSYGKGRGGSVVIAKDLPPIVLHHGFLATVKAVGGKGDVKEHDGIFLRARGSPNVQARGRNGQPRKFTALGFAERLPIKQQFGPGILEIVMIPKVLEDIQFDAAAEMQRQSLSQLARFTTPAAPEPSSE